MPPIRSERVILRELLRELLREQPDSGALVYLPSGCREMRRMISRLLLVRPSQTQGDRISELIRELKAHDEAHSPLL